MNNISFPQYPAVFLASSDHIFCNTKTLQTVLEEWKIGKIDQKLLSEIKKQPCFFEIAPLTRSKSLFDYSIIPTTFPGSANPTAFKDNFIDKSENIAVFQSLTGNYLISPTNTKKDYHHIQKFLINADEDKEIKPFFKAWAEIAEKALENREVVWLSTHGKNVPWLHGRVDFQPKQYHTERFKTVTTD